MHRFIGKGTPAPGRRAAAAAATPAPPSSDLPSSSPAFGTPAHPLKPFAPTPSTRHAVLPIVLPPATLRPLAFRTFTKKHSLTLTSSSLEELASFIGRHCGSGWREEGLAEKVLEEVAKSWKNRNGGVIVDGANPELKEILTTLEANMSGGRIIPGAKGLSRQNSSLLLDAAQEADLLNARKGLPPVRGTLTREDSLKSFGMSNLGVDDEIDDEALNDVRKWLKVVDSYDQPRLVYNVDKKHFEKETTKASIMPSAPRKTLAFRNRYNVMHQRLLRHESFQTSTVMTARNARQKGPSSGQTSLKITPIANMLGRHGSQQMLLGLLVILPAGELAISDLTGTISLDLSRAVDYPPDSSWFTPGMIVLVDGIYEEEDESTGNGLGGTRGIGGVLGGKFLASFIGHLTCEPRASSMGMSVAGGQQEQTIGGGFGWIDFLGVGSERAVGQKMRRVEQRLFRQLTADQASDRARMVILGELHLDDPRTLPAVRRILSLYAAESQAASPLCIVMTGNFTKYPIMTRGKGRGSVEYKESFDELGTVLAEFPSLVKDTTFLFVPGDNDAWISAGATGASTPIPRKSVPELFTSRIRRVFASQATDDESRAKAEAVWASNPARLSLFGPNHEIVVFRDDILARMQRNSVTIKHRREETEGEDAPSQANNNNTGTDDVTMSDAPAAGESQTGDESTETTDADKTRRNGAEETAAARRRTAQKLVKTILDQAHLSPFPPSIRPVNWDYSSALHLYPLPSAMVLVDTTCPPFCITYGRCHVMNPGSLLVPDRRGVARWIEYRVGSLGQERDCSF